MENKKELGKIKDRINKLLALANSPNEHEAANAARMAARLMVKYKITKDQALRHHEHSPVVVRYETKFIKIPFWVRYIADCIEKSMGVFVSYGHGRGNVRGHMLIHGEESDITMFTFFFESLSNQIEMHAKRFLRAEENANLNRSEKQFHAKSYKVGLAEAVGELLGAAMTREYEAENQARKGTGSALVVTNSDKYELAGRFAHSVSRVRLRRERIRVDAESHRRGMTDADKVTVNRGLGDQNEQLRIGGGK